MCPLLPGNCNPWGSRSFLPIPESSCYPLRLGTGGLGVFGSGQAVEHGFDGQRMGLVRQLFEEATGEAVKSGCSNPVLMARFAGLFRQDGTRISFPDSLAEQC